MARKKSQPVEELIEAIREGDALRVRELLTAGADPNTKTFHGSPVMIAAERPSSEVLQALIDAGADVNVGTILETALQAAIKAGRSENACMLIQAGADLAQRTVVSSPPLFEAIKQGDLRVVQAVIDGGADLNLKCQVRDDSPAFREAVGRAVGTMWTTSPEPDTLARSSHVENPVLLTVTPLILAAKRGHVEIVRALLRGGANRHEQDGEGHTAYDWAGQAHSDVLRVLMEAGPPQVSPDDELLRAAQKGDASAIAHLQSQGANLEARDRRDAHKGMTPLMLAASAGRREAVQALLDAGADVNAVDDPAQKKPANLAAIFALGSLESVKQSGFALARTALMHAAEHRQVEVAQFLISKGADVNHQDYLGFTALLIAAEAGDTQLVHALIEAGANVGWRGPNRTTALLLSAEQGDKESVRLLIDAGASVNIKDKDGSTALMYAVERGDHKLAALLIDAGADPNPKSKQGGILEKAVGACESVTTGEGVRSLKPLATERLLPLVQLLLRSGVAIDTPDVLGNTPLITSVCNGRLELIKPFLDRGANIDAQSDGGWTALHWAVRRNLKEAVIELLERSANTERRLKNGQTPLDVAVDLNLKEIADLLRSAAKKQRKIAPPPAKQVLQSEPEESWRTLEIPQPDFRKAAKAASYKEAVKQLAEICGNTPHEFNIKGGFSIQVHSKKKVDLPALHEEFLQKGCYVFISDSGELYEKQKTLTVLPTTDKYEVIAAMQTNGQGMDLLPGGVIHWLKELEAEQPFVLTGIGFDFLEGRFKSRIQKPKALAERMYEFCPDIVDQGCGSVELLAAELRKGQQFFFWWD